MATETSSPLILFIILNWNSSEDTKNCINSLVPQLKNNQKIVVVDNDSTDDSFSLLTKTFPWLHIIQNERNLGFQGGMNIGIQYAVENDYEFLMLLNSDTIAAPDMIEILVSTFPDDAAIVSPGIYYMAEQNRLCSTGGRINSIFLETIIKARIKNPNIALKLEFLPSHAWLIRTSIFKIVGLLDESFFPLYYDDLDFCLRLKKRGYKLYLIPSAKIYHNVSISLGGKNSPKERYYMTRNSGFYFRKNMSIWQAPLIFTYRLGSLILWSTRLMQRKNSEALRSYWKGYKEGWFGKLPDTIKNPK
jgi:GT2 family glycosyltransferase